MGSKGLGMTGKNKKNIFPKNKQTAFLFYHFSIFFLFFLRFLKTDTKMEKCKESNYPQAQQAQLGVQRASFISCVFYFFALAFFFFIFFYVGFFYFLLFTFYFLLFTFFASQKIEGIFFAPLLFFATQKNRTQKNAPLLFYAEGAHRSFFLHRSADAKK
jgi:hypothetical protein